MNARFNATLRGFTIWAGLAVLLPLAADAASITLKVVDKEPPAELDASIRTTLQPKAVQLQDGGKVLFEFWFAKEIPLGSKPDSVSKALDSIRQTTVLGAVNVASARRDYRDDEIYAGVYTLRFVLQPQDGNHLGTSEFNYYVALVPAKSDPRLDGIADYKSLVKASSKETATEHPIILSLRPATSDEGELPKLNEPVPNHKCVRVKVPAKAAGDGQATSVTFDLVFEGKGKK